MAGGANAKAAAKTDAATGRGHAMVRAIKPSLFGNSRVESIPTNINWPSDSWCCTVETSRYRSKFSARRRRGSAHALAALSSGARQHSNVSHTLERPKACDGSDANAFINLG